MPCDIPDAHACCWGSGMVYVTWNCLVFWELEEKEGNVERKKKVASLCLSVWSTLLQNTADTGYARGSRLVGMVTDVWQVSVFRSGLHVGGGRGYNQSREASTGWVTSVGIIARAGHVTYDMGLSISRWVNGLRRVVCILGTCWALWLKLPSYAVVSHNISGGRKLKPSHTTPLPSPITETRPLKPNNCSLL